MKEKEEIEEKEHNNYIISDLDLRFRMVQEFCGGSRRG